ncbi:MAG: hypothetical protein GY755_13575 [Chloroflexi bacterium]|nr:hypothetical protein [Chloroflexota bacterium]
MKEGQVITHPTKEGETVELVAVKEDEYRSCDGCVFGLSMNCENEKIGKLSEEVGCDPVDGLIYKFKEEVG